MSQCEVPQYLRHGGIPIVDEEGNFIIVGCSSRNSAGGGWASSYDRYLDRKREKRKREIELAEAEEAAQQLDAVDREIARLLHEQEKQDLERAESERLLRMARQYADSADVAEKVRAAMAKAAALETFGALEALKRELERAAEEEEVALLLILNQ